MIAIGFILIGLGLGLIIGNVESTLLFLLVGAIVGALMYTKIGIYGQLKSNKTISLGMSIFMGIVGGIIVGYIINHMIGSIVLGVGIGILEPSLQSYFRSMRIKRHRK